MNTQQFNTHYSEKNPVIDVNYNYSISDNEPSFSASESTTRSIKRDARFKQKPSVVNRKQLNNSKKSDVDYEEVNFDVDA
jgi:hypothetical protein